MAKWLWWWSAVLNILQIMESNSNSLKAAGYFKVFSSACAYRPAPAFLQPGCLWAVTNFWSTKFGNIPAVWFCSTNSSSVLVPVNCLGPGRSSLCSFALDQCDVWWTFAFSLPAFLFASLNENLLEDFLSVQGEWHWHSCLVGDNAHAWAGLRCDRFGPAAVWYRWWGPKHHLLCSA